MCQITLNNQTRTVWIQLTLLDRRKKTFKSTTCYTYAKFVKHFLSLYTDLYTEYYMFDNMFEIFNPTNWLFMKIPNFHVTFSRFYIKIILIYFSILFFHPFTINFISQQTISKSKYLKSKNFSLLNNLLYIRQTQSHLEAKKLNNKPKQKKTTTMGKECETEKKSYSFSYVVRWTFDNIFCAKLYIHIHILS